MIHRQQNIYKKLSGIIQKTGRMVGIDGQLLIS